MIYDVLTLVCLIAMSVLGFLIAVKPGYRALWVKARAGLAYALLWIRARQYDENERGRADKAP